MTRLAIFDFDGTIADSAAWFFDTVNEAARRHRFREVDSQEREMLRHRSSREIMGYLGVSRWRLPAIARTMRAAMERDIDRISPFAFVPELFKALTSEGISIAVVSSNSEANIRAILGPELTRYVDHFDTGASVFGKARHLRRAISRTKACRAVAIGDEERDVHAAQKVGIPALSVTWGYAATTALVAAHPANVVTEPGELVGAIKTALST